MGARRQFLTPAMPALALAAAALVAFATISADARASRPRFVPGIVPIADAAPPVAVSPAPSAAEPGPAPMSASELGRICAQVPCRGDGPEVRLVAADGGSFRFKPQRFPYADPDGNVIIYPGEALEFSFDRTDISHPRFVRVVGRSADGSAVIDRPEAEKPGSFTIELVQVGAKPGMLLMLKNATGVALRYDATMYVPARDGMRMLGTSSCPVLSGMGGSEMWPDPIVMLELSHFRVEPMGEGGGPITLSC